ncbi:MAG: hypothetical protein PHF21_02695 [Bacilli bacterium]|nr:hypothetical protein [Bacilli bacterium]
MKYKCSKCGHVQYVSSKPSYCPNCNRSLVNNTTFYRDDDIDIITEFVLVTTIIDDSSTSSDYSTSNDSYSTSCSDSSSDSSSGD